MQDQFSSFDGYADLSGQTFGRLSVVRFSHEPQRHRRFWVCLCACGTERTLREDYIKRGLATCAVCRRVEIANRKGPRLCSGCRQMLSRDQFYRDRTTTDALARYCSSCTRSKAHTLRARMRRRRPEDIVQPTEKRCNDCGLIKQTEHFWTDRTKPDGLANRCAECKTLEQRAWYMRVGRARRLPKARAARYGIRTTDLDAMLHSQAGQCAICGTVFDGPKSFYIDHDHNTGKVRGLLCPPCNNGLGAFHDSPETLRVAIGYLEHHSCAATT